MKLFNKLRITVAFGIFLLYRGAFSDYFKILRKFRGSGGFSQRSPILPTQVLAFTPQKYPLTQFPDQDSRWGILNFRGDSSACRRRVDRLTDPIFACAALFAAQKEQTETE